MSELLPAVEINPSTPATATVICLHGLGVDGNDLAPLAGELARPPHAVRFVFPHAPVRTITRSGGMPLPAWYDVYGPDLAGKFDEVGIRSSEQQLRALIGREVERGIPARRIVLAGFSQGGAMALHTGLRYPQRLGGILALSTYLLLPDTLQQEAQPANADVPIMMTHGTGDDIIPFPRGEMSRRSLEKLGYQIDWRVYQMPHTLCQQEIEDMAEWLDVVFNTP
ncbi:MAG: alpha/beta hydrolase-fold protein [Gammaproteobacteria bacterium]